MPQPALHFPVMLIDPEIEMFFIAFFSCVCVCLYHFFSYSTESNLELGIAFSCHFSLGSFNMDRFHSLSLSFVTLFLKSII